MGKCVRSLGTVPPCSDSVVTHLNLRCNLHLLLHRHLHHDDLRLRHARDALLGFVVVLADGAGRAQEVREEIDGDVLVHGVLLPELLASDESAVARSESENGREAAEKACGADAVAGLLDDTPIDHRLGGADNTARAAESRAAGFTDAANAVLVLGTHGVGGGHGGHGDRGLHTLDVC